MHQNLCLPAPRVHRTLENCPDPNALQSSFLFISEHLSPGRNYSGSPTNYNQKKISNNSLPTILWVLSLFFCLSIEWTQTYVSIIIFRQFLTAAENNQIKKTKNLLQHHISKRKRTEYCLYTYTKLSFLGFWPDSKPIIVTLTLLLHYLYYISCNSL